MAEFVSLLFDTNILIPLEGGSSSSPEDEGLVRELHALVLSLAVRAWLHPAQILDLERARSAVARNERRTQWIKYPKIPDAPRPSSWLREKLDVDPPEGSNSWVDLCLLESVLANAVTHLVTEDKQLTRRARSAGLGDRVLSIRQAHELLVDLVDSREPSSHFEVRTGHAHQINGDDPILCSLRNSYGAEAFDRWLRKCQHEHRPCLMISGPDSCDRLAALAILHRQDQGLAAYPDPTLKICTFKVAEGSLGLRLGELLLSAVFEWSRVNGFHSQFVEVTHSGEREQLLSFLNDFGFSYEGRKEGCPTELILRKTSAGDFDESGRTTDRLEHFRLKGPFSVLPPKPDEMVHLVPIQPNFHDRLFPDLGLDLPLSRQWEPCGNTLRKAYLCRSATRQLKPGSLIFFYRSESKGRSPAAVTTAGVVEGCSVLQDPEAIYRATRARTVFPRKSIERLASKPVLVIQFRHAPILPHEITREELVRHTGTFRPPPSIQRLRPESLNYLWNRTICSSQ